MKLLIITQAVDRKHTVLGFFTRWIEEFAKDFERVTVICLEKGEYIPPSNVKVLSLGKEKGASRLKYIVNFYRYIWAEREQYDAVFIHMNQEYVLLGWKIWWLLGKKIYLWRNHHEGNALTDIAAFFCDKVFCTSKYSYTAKYKKTMLMPVGIDTDTFQPSKAAQKKPHSILFLARIAPVKKPHLLFEALDTLHAKGISFAASFYGDPLKSDMEYYISLQETAKKRGLESLVAFHAGIPNEKTVEVYNAHEICVNLSSSGMYDKTIFEAMACGALSLSCNKNLEGQVDRRLLFKENDVADLAAKLEGLLAIHENERLTLLRDERALAESHSLKALAKKLSAIISSAPESPFRSFLSARARLIRYVVAGGTAAFVNAGLLYLFTKFFGIWYVASAVVAFLIGVVISFFLQKFWTFRDASSDGVHRQAGIYFLIMLANLALNTLIVFLLTDRFHIFYVLSQLIASLLLAFVSFFIYRKLFKTLQ